MNNIERCPKCGARLILVWVGGTIPWHACPLCDSKELLNCAKRPSIINS